ncbi:hypothetical protein LL965_02990 [Xanthomonas cassavae CFBP 4642]|uniref:Uncharacterized protein n=2 Tax=Xanthomonas cassavae TaxID=56450 RepID=A0ABS8HBD0_9XANT|nr:hypothetical protein [Xanthomonas cassavae]MCC4619089.1 hypothetical protein [Xanthomonas cassavae CFBP 4642]
MSSMDEVATEQSADIDGKAIKHTDTSFPSLSSAMAHYAQVTEQSRAGPIERWSLTIGLIGAGIGILSGALLDGKAGSYLAVFGLVTELTGFLISAALTVKREWPGFRRPYADHAELMEREFHQYQSIVAALRRFPLEQRRRREAFMRDRRTNMHDRLGLFTGGMEKLGFMPVLLALYLQLKDWRLGGWAVLSKITLIQGVLAFTLLFAFAMSWHLIRLRTRVQSYEQLLAEANRQDSTPNK